MKKLIMYISMASISGMMNAMLPLKTAEEQQAIDQRKTAFETHFISYLKNRNDARLKELIYDYPNLLTTNLLLLAAEAGRGDIFEILLTRPGMFVEDSNIKPILIAAVNGLISTRKPALREGYLHIIHLLFRDTRNSRLLKRIEADPYVAVSDAEVAQIFEKLLEANKKRQRSEFKSAIKLFRRHGAEGK